MNILNPPSPSMKTMKNHFFFENYTLTEGRKSRQTYNDKTMSLNKKLLSLLIVSEYALNE